MIKRDYLAPGEDGNSSLFYQLPKICVIMDHLRMCGGDLRGFSKRYIKERQHRKEVLVRVVAMIDSDEKRKEEFEKIRATAERLAVLEAEDTLLRMCKPGSANSFRSLTTVLNAGTSKWKQQKQNVVVTTVQEAQPTPEEKVTSYIESLESNGS